MTIHKGIAPLIIVLGIALVLAVGGAYVAVHPAIIGTPAIHQEATTTAEVHTQTAPGDHPEVDHSANEGIVLSGADIHWKIDEPDERGYMPYTHVSVLIGETMHDLGTFVGHCNQIGVNGDSNPLLAGELAAVQCWWGGGGNEIGVFAHEDGGYQIMIGDLDEGGAHDLGIRGNFKIKADVAL